MTRGRAGLGALNSGINNSTLETQSLAYLNMVAGMSAPGTSNTSATPTLKDKKGLVKELGQRAAVDILSQGMSENEKEIMNTAFRGYYGKIEQKKNDKKIQSAAIRSTVVTAVTTVATMGASGALGPGFNSFLTTVGAGSANMGAAIVNLGVQVADGSRNGADGMAAGFINGAIGMVTQRGELDIVGKAGSFLEKTTLGLGVSYDRQAGWGGMIGVGGSKGNIGISFSQKGNTNINGSLDVGRGLQITGSITSNGEKTIGANFNPSNEGPRRGYNFGVNYDMNGGGLSGNVGYTDAESGIGITSTIDRNGLSTSSQLNGNNIGTMTEDGYQSDEFNWAQNNINLAQNRTDELATAATEKNLLKEKNMSDAEIDAMSPEDRKREANQILREKENKKLGDSKLFTQDELNNMSQADREIHLDRIDGVDSFENMSADTVTKLALGLVGSMAGLAGIAFAWGSTTTPAPERSQIAEPLVATRPRREEEYDPQTGQMLVTDENGNMKLFYKDEDGNLRVKEKDQDGNILDRMPNPKEFMNEVRSYQGYSQGATIINVSDTKTERQSSINKESTPTRILDKNPQSSLIINSYNEKIVKSLQDIEKNRSILIQKETNRESILNSDEGFLLKQNESNAKYALESIERSLNDVNIKHSEAIAQYNKYAADYGILIVKGQLDPKAFDGLMKNHYEGILKPAEDELNLANKSKLPLINKYKSEVKIATEKTNKYVEIQSKKIKEGITNSKILEATKLLSKLNSADIDPKLKAACEKLELAEKNLNNTKAEPGTKE